MGTGPYALLGVRPLFERVLKGIWIPVPKRERGKAFLQEQELGVIAAEFGIV